MSSAATLLLLHQVPSSDLCEPILTGDNPVSPYYTLLSDQEASIAPDCLRAHSIKDGFRAKMVDWMIEVTASFGCSSQTYFLAVSLMDRYFDQKRTRLHSNELHEIGVTCMFIAAKYADVVPLFMTKLVAKIAHGKLTHKQIATRECDILATVEFNVAPPTCMDFLDALSTDFGLNLVVYGQTQAILYVMQIYYQLGALLPSECTAIAVALALLTTGDAGKIEPVFRALKFTSYELIEQVFVILKAYPTLFPQLVSAQRFLAFTIETTANAVTLSYMNQQLSRLDVQV